MNLTFSSFKGFFRITCEHDSCSLQTSTHMETVSRWHAGGQAVGLFNGSTVCVRVCVRVSVCASVSQLLSRSESLPLSLIRSMSPFPAMQ